MEKKSWTYSSVGIWSSGYLSVRNSDILWSVMATEEQMYLPFTVGHSRRKIFALARSSTWTIEVFNRWLYWSLSPTNDIRVKSNFLPGKYWKKKKKPWCINKGFLVCIFIWQASDTFKLTPNPFLLQSHNVQTRAEKIL